MYRNYTRQATVAQINAYRDSVRTQFAGQGFQIDSNSYGLRAECTECHESATLNPEMWMRNHTCAAPAVEEAPEAPAEEAAPEAPAVEQFLTYEYSAEEVARLIEEARKATTVKDDRAIVDMLRDARSSEVQWLNNLARDARNSHGDADDYDIVQFLARQTV